MRWAVTFCYSTGDPDSDYGLTEHESIHPACRGSDHQHATEAEAEACPANNAPLPEYKPSMG